MATRIVIEVDGGNVQAVFAPHGADFEIVIVDHDNLKAEGKDYDAREAVMLKACEGNMTQVA